MKCTNCGSMRLQLVPEEDPRMDEPGHAEFYECWDCGAANDIDIDEGSLGDYQLELEKGAA